MDVDNSTSPLLLSLQEQIQSLTDLHTRFQALRQIPPLLLRPPVSTALPQPQRQDFKEIKDVAEVLRSEKVQKALRAAQESQKEDKSDLNFNLRRENRKRRRLPSPESPQPYKPTQRKPTSLFPPNEDNAMTVDLLPGYIREFNKTHQSKLHLWSRTQPMSERDAIQLANPLIVRFTVRDVLTIFIYLGHAQEKSALIVEGATAFGPREKKSPHSQSDYNTFQALSQQFFKMIHSHPYVSFQAFATLLCSYEGIFMDRCLVCDRVLSVEGHVPPVARLWVDAEKEGEAGKWEPRHVTCLQN